MGLGGQTVTFQIVGGGGRCNRELMAYNKLRGCVDMFPKEIFEKQSEIIFDSFQTFKVHFS